MANKDNEVGSDNKHIDYNLIKTVLARLSKVIEQEEELIIKEKFTEVYELIPNKIELVSFFEKHQQHILKIVKEEENNTERFDSFKELVRKLLDSSNANMTRIKKAEFIANETVDITKKLMKEKEQKHKNYSNKGVKSAESGSVFINTKT